MILGDRQTEIWGRLYWPIEKEPRPHPLVVILHGNHATCGLWYGTSWRGDYSCEYTNTGICPTGKVIVPNHRGFDYLATRLASWGYMVVSINANRGINCGSGVSGDAGLNLARGRLILKHLQIVSEWNRGVRPAPRKFGVDLRNQFDLSQVGLLGHSRGGEGVRAAYHLYRDPESPWPKAIGEPVVMRSIFEIGGMDGQQERLLDPEGVAWAQILPACDGDNALLLGVRPYDRVMQAHAEEPASLKSLLYVYGANHNYFSTEWHESDSYGCYRHQPLFTPDQPSTTGSAQQRQVALISVLGFFRGSLGANRKAEFLKVFDPQYSLPASLRVITPIERTYLSTPNTKVNPVFENFEASEPYNFFGFLNDFVNVSQRYGYVPDYYSELRAGHMAWQSPESEAYFQTNWSDSVAGVDASRGGYLGFRAARAPNSFPINESVDFGLRLIDTMGNASSEVRLSEFGNLPEPVGYYGWVHPVLNSFLIPMSAFKEVHLESLKGLRFIFNGNSYGRIYLDEIRYIPGPSVEPPTRSPWGVRVKEEQAVPIMMRRMARMPSKSELRFVADEAFPVGGSLLTLKADGEEFTLSEFYDPSDLRKVRFIIPPEKIPSALASKQLQIEAGPRRWDVSK